MIPMLISAAVRARITCVKSYAETHRLDLAALQALMGHGHLPDVHERELEIPFGFRAVYSIEEQPEPVGWCHHLSFSIAAPGRTVHPSAVVMLIEEFGLAFPGWDKCFIQIEETSPRKPVHVLLPLCH